MEKPISSNDLLTETQRRINSEYLYQYRAGQVDPSEKQIENYGRTTWFNEKGAQTTVVAKDKQLEREIIYENMLKAKDTEVLDSGNHSYGGKWFNKYKLGIA